MSNQKVNPLVVCREQIAKSLEKFATSDLSFEKEEVYAIQHLMKNDYLLQTAVNDPASLRLAMYNVAALGLSLNPTRGLAYLIPRSDKKGQPAKVLLDISYRGLIALAQSEGIVENVVCELVYEQDSYLFNGPLALPQHQADPFSTNRGKVIGGYCITELKGGKVQVHNMSRKDMDQIRDASQAASKGFSPWSSWEPQMQLKSIVKRAAKWWPASTEKMAKVIEYLNVDAGEGLPLKDVNQVKSVANVAPAVMDDINPQALGFINQALTRAVQTQSFEACKELLESRLQDPAVRAYGLTELTRLQQQSAVEQKTA